MSAINYIAGINRAFDYVRVAGGYDKKYEPAMVITRDRIKGKSFWITMPAMWKYMEPDSYKGDEQAVRADLEDFGATGGKFMREYETAKRQLAMGYLIGENRKKYLDQRDAAEGMLEVCRDAQELGKFNHYYLCVAFNLLLCMQGLQITPCKQPRKAAAQLLIWLQSKLPELKNMPPYEEKQELTVGHIGIKGNQFKGYIFGNCRATQICT